MRCLKNDAWPFASYWQSISCWLDRNSSERKRLQPLRRGGAGAQHLQVRGTGDDEDPEEYFLTTRAPGRKLENQSTQS
jgi:hypothetical protein